MELRAFDHKVWPINNAKSCIQFSQISISLFLNTPFLSHNFVLIMLYFTFQKIPEIELSKHCSIFSIRVDFEIA